MEISDCMNKSNPKGVYSLPTAWLGTQAVSGCPALGASVPARPRRRGRREEPGTGGGREGVGDGQERQQSKFNLYRARVPELEVKVRPSSLPSSWGACSWYPQPSRISIPSLPRKGAKARGRRGAGRGADKSAAGATWRSREPERRAADGKRPAGAAPVAAPPPSVFLPTAIEIRSGGKRRNWNSAETKGAGKYL